MIVKMMGDVLSDISSFLTAMRVVPTGVLFQLGMDGTDPLGKRD